MTPSSEDTGSEEEPVILTIIDRSVADSTPSPPPSLLLLLLPPSSSLLLPPRQQRSQDVNSAPGGNLSRRSPPDRRSVLRQLIEEHRLHRLLRCPPFPVTAAVFGPISDWTRPMLTFYDDATENAPGVGGDAGNWGQDRQPSSTSWGRCPRCGRRRPAAALADGAIGSAAGGPGAHVRFGAGEADDAVAVFTSVGKGSMTTTTRRQSSSPRSTAAPPVRDLAPGNADFSTAVRVPRRQLRRTGAGRRNPETTISTADVLASRPRLEADTGRSHSGRRSGSRPAAWADADARSPATCCPRAGLGASSTASVANA